MSGSPFLLALGSNLGDRSAHLTDAIEYFRTRFRVEAVSRTVESEAWGPVPQGPYLNLVLRGRGVPSPFALLEIAREAERRAGRTRELRWGPRTLDVDVIFYGGYMLESDELILPHPRWEERPFVRDLVPEVAGSMRDPRSRRPLAGEDGRGGPGGHP